MLRQIDQQHPEPSAKLERSRKAELGQFMTPSSVASFMASLFTATEVETACLLDAGAGLGSLTTAFLDRCVRGELGFRCIEVTAFEIDNRLRKQLEQTLAGYRQHLNLSLEITGRDFVEEAVDDLQLFGAGPRFTHAILNPPYKKISSDSRHRLLLRQVGIETVNLYSAFVALALALMAPEGQIVAIIPRSFCNGPYYRPFREFVLDRAAIRQIHLFAARDKAFRDDSVLQETVIIHLQGGGRQGEVIISTSTDDSFADYARHTHAFDRIVLPQDPQRFIHIPTSLVDRSMDLFPQMSYSLADLGVEVSTGPVVDFRLRQHIRDMPEPGTVPLLYPVHFSGRKMQWPKPGMKKPNAIQRSAETEKWLFPNGFYTVVRRFSSKEEKRRIVASVVEPGMFRDAPLLGFENHLNVFHHHKSGLSQSLAIGLAVYLNSSVCDEQFRRFNGHTQVNATDLRLMKYPNRQALIRLGEWAQARGELTQFMIDEQVQLIAQ